MGYTEEIISLRLEGKSWGDIRLEYKKLYEVRKSNLYTISLINKIKELGISFFETEANKTRKSIPQYLQDLFGIDRSEIGDIIRKAGFELYYKYQWTSGGRKLSNKQKLEYADCAIRTFTNAFGISYKKSKKLCIDNSSSFVGKNPEVNGVKDVTIEEILKSKNWSKIEFIKEILSQNISLDGLFCRAPKLKNENLIISTNEHIFYVEKGVLKDRWDDGLSHIEEIYSPDCRKLAVYNSVKNLNPIKNTPLESSSKVFQEIANLRWSSPRSNTWDKISNRFQISKKDWGFIGISEHYIEEVKELFLYIGKEQIKEWETRRIGELDNLISKRFRIKKGYTESVTRCI